MNYYFQDYLHHNGPKCAIFDLRLPERVHSNHPCLSVCVALSGFSEKILIQDYHYSSI